MSMTTMGPPSASMSDVAAANLGNPGNDEVVEVSLLLPSRWASDLFELARERHQSVGQIIRSMIGHALREGGYNQKSCTGV
jgi:hypothetical protein